MTEEFPPNLVYYPPTDDHIDDHAAKPEPQTDFWTFWNETKLLFKRKYTPGPWRFVVKQAFPFLNIFQRKYTLQHCISDILAGLTVTTLLIPQSLSYATLAGLPPQFGLFTATVACFIYFLLGTCRETSLGPFALVSLMVSQIINDMYPELTQLEITDPSQALHLRLIYTFSLTFVSGLQLLVLGILKLGWLIDLFSSPSLQAFLMGAAYAVGATQIGTLCAVKTTQKSFLVTFISFIVNLPSTINWATTLIGIIALLVISLSDIYSSRKKFAIPIPSQIILVIIGTILSAVFGFNENFDVKVIGAIESGFPTPTIPSFYLIFTDARYWMNSIPITISSFVVLCSISAQLQEQHRDAYRVNYNSEIMTLSVSSLLGAFLNSYPSSAAYSRTTVVNACKPHTSLWNIATFSALILVVFVMGPLVYHLPMTILAAIVLASFRLSYMNWRQGVNIFKQNAGEGIVYYVTFFTTICIGINAGVYAALLSSIGHNVICQASFSTNFTFLRPIPQTQRFVSYKRIEGGEMAPFQSYLTNIENLGGIYKVRAHEDAKTARLRKKSNTSPNHEEDRTSGQENVLDSTLDSSYDGYHQFHNPSSPNGVNLSSTPDIESISAQSDTLQYGNPNDQSFISISPLNSTEDPKVLTLYIGDPITHLNATAITDYLIRYIEMFQEYHKVRDKTAALDVLEHSLPPLGLRTNLDLTSNESQLESVFSLAPTYLKHRINQISTTTVNTNQGNDVSDSLHQSTQTNRNFSLPNSSRNEPSQSIDETQLSDFLSTTPSIISQIKWKSPLSKLLSTQQKDVLSALIEYTLDKVDADRINKYEHVIILDYVSRIDITALKLLQNFVLAHPQLLLLFTHPGQELTTTFSRNFPIPTGFVFDGIFTATEFAHCLLQIAQDGRSLENYQAEMQQISPDLSQEQV